MIRPGVGILVLHGKKLLLGRRGKVWDIPQGGIEPGESEIEAAKRELSEELGITTQGITPAFLTQEELRFPFEKDGHEFEGKSYRYFVFQVSDAPNGPFPEFPDGGSLMDFANAKRAIESTQRGKKGQMMLRVLDKLQARGFL